MSSPSTHDWLAHRARHSPAAPALHGERGETVTYTQLAAEAAALAAALPREPGTHVVLELEPGLEHAYAMHAAIAAGVPFATLRPGLPPAEREAALAGEPAAMIDAEWLRRARAEAPAGAALSPSPGDLSAPLCRVLTSGTSGARKTVELTRGNHLWSAAASAFNLGLVPGELWLCCLPLDHIGGLSIPIRSLIYGTAAVIHPRFDPERVAAELAARPVTLVSLVPTQLRRLLDAGAPLERPRALLLGGAPLPEELRVEATERGATVLASYGLTEACSQVSTVAPADAGADRPRGGAGRPLLGVGVEIDAGEIVVSGPTVAPAAAGPDGRLRTGDRGELDERGELRVLGRLDDVIVTGGENVAPEEVEAALLTHPRVREAAVVGRPDRDWGSAVTAVVVTAPGTEPDPDELRAHCRATLAPHKVPKSVELAEGLPRTASGKLLRRLLR
jgi:o-succinylbenzoate---CoA ligase